MAPRESCQMVGHYFQREMPAELALRLEQAISGDDALRLPGLNFTPAQLEQVGASHSCSASIACVRASNLSRYRIRRPPARLQMCAEFEDLEELVSHIEGLAMPKTIGFKHQASSVVKVP